MTHLPRNGRLSLAFTVAAAALVAGFAAPAAHARGALPPSCPKQELTPEYIAAVNGALAQQKDIWGNALLQSPDGPTYEGVEGYLKPLMLVGRPGGMKPSQLTDSGIYYLPFGRPLGANGAESVMLHVADGSQIVSEYALGPRLSIDVGAGGNERYGSCLARLTPAQLYQGYLPVLETKYVDADGVRYSQESFATRIPQTGSLVSLVRLTIDARGSLRDSVRVRFTPSLPHLRRDGNRLLRGKKADLLFSPGGSFDGSSVVYSATQRRPRTVYVAWLAHPSRARFLIVGRRSYEKAKRAVVTYWNNRLAQTAAFDVPEQRVLDAERNLLIQNMLLSWRYSTGNSYETFSWELIDDAEVMGDYGLPDIDRAILEKSFHRGTFFPSRARAQRMIGSAFYYRRFGDRAYIDRVTPVFQGYLADFEDQLATTGKGLLDRERYGADIAFKVYGIHTQTVVLQGLRMMAGVWLQTGYPRLAERALNIATRLDAGLRQAVQASAIPLPDGSLFVPMALLDQAEQPYDALTASRLGSYWNLVMPYALASGFFSPGGPEALGLLRYMLNHGSRFLGLVRFAAYPNPGTPGYRAPGSDDVYGVNVARFLADNDQADQLVLSLYGKLGAGMTPDTFVSGEGSTIGPVPGEYYRSMSRPPNSANNAFFLQTLRLMLVHETADASGAPQGLQLAYSTPRPWLWPGKQIVVRQAPTSFGPLSYSIESSAGSVHVHVSVPSRVPLESLSLRLRLPDGRRIAAVTLDGSAYTRFDPAAETIDLSGLAGELDLVATLS